MKTRLTISTAMAAIFLTGTALSAPVGETPGELWVDGPLDARVGLSPQSPDASADHRGRQIYVWDDDTTGEDTGLDVFLRVLDSDGTSLVGPTRVNTLTADNQRFARLAVSADGSFLVIWESFEPVMGSPGVFYSKIRSQLFDADGSPDGSEQLLSTVSTDLQTPAFSNVAALTGGGFVAVWQSWNSANPMDTSVGYSIQGRQVGSDGAPAGGQFQVNSLMTGTFEEYASVTGLQDGGFLAVWSNPQIQARRFMANGTPVGNDFQVNTFVGVSFRDQTDVATHGDGRVLVVWRDDEDGPSEEIRGRMYDHNVSPLGADFRINTFTTDTQSIPQVAGYGRAGFFVIWQSFGSSGADPTPTSIEGRIVTGVNSFADSQFLVNEFTTNSQESPGIGGRGGYVAMAWLSRENAEVQGQVIMGQWWNVCGIFCDGYE